MNIFTPSLKKGFKLVVSPPNNEPDFALAAQDEGADAIKFHINLLHPASKMDFGTWKEEKPKLLKIMEKVVIPLGIVPGAKNLPDPKEMEDICESGFDFWDMFIHHLPAYFLQLPKLGKMLAVTENIAPRQIREIKNLGIEAIEASIVPGEEYHQPLTVKDLVNYKIIAQEAGIPIMIPTQKKIKPREVGLLKEVGACGLVIGAVVTGTELKEFSSAVRKFRKAVDEL